MLQILPRIQTTISRKAISFGVLSWETLSKTYFVADPSQISNDDITKGDFFGVVSWETLSKTYFDADPSQNSNDDITKGDFFWRSELGDFK